MLDAHIHLWHYTPAQYGWIDDSLAALRRDFLPADLAAVQQQAGVTAAIAVQARETLDETRWLLALAAQSSAIAGVVGWVPLTAPNLPAVLDEFAANPHLVGVREIAQGQPAGFFDNPAFNRGIAELTRRNLAYDILIYAHQLPEATRFAARHPAQRFILDHVAKPPIASGNLEPWRTHLRALAALPNVACKLSGLITEADWSTWTLDTLRPYLDAALEAFGPARLLAGSDWPVCLAAGSCTRWWQTLLAWLEPLPAADREAIFIYNTRRLYNLT